MNIQKADTYRRPRYPDRDAALRDPSLLAATPERWKRNAAACAALAAASAMLLASCSETAGGKGSPSAPVPLFEHGIGRGGFGCVSVAPPAFLSEADALEVINEVAQQEGILFAAGGASLQGVDIPETNVNPNPSEAVAGYRTGTLALDGYDKNKQVAFEYVSSEDMEEWCSAEARATYTSYDFLGTARALNGSVNRAGAGMTVAVFYNPGYQTDKAREILDENGLDYGDAEEKLRELEKEDLRAQVRDFITWLKAQGII